MDKNTPDIVFFEPRIPGNTGNAIRLAAVVGFTLHLIEPLGFELDDKRVKRAGLDYHELSHLKTHKSFEDFLNTIDDNSNIYAFTSHTTTNFPEIKFTKNDFLLFGPEPTGLPDGILNHQRVTQKIRIPMKDNVRCLNLAVSASIAVYEAWRQLDYQGSL